MAVAAARRSLVIRSGATGGLSFGAGVAGLPMMARARMVFAPRLFAFSG
jgi:hypothetical protein